MTLCRLVGGSRVVLCVSFVSVSYSEAAYMLCNMLPSSVRSPCWLHMNRVRAMVGVSVGLLHCITLQLSFRAWLDKT